MPKGQSTMDTPDNLSRYKTRDEGRQNNRHNTKKNQKMRNTRGEHTNRCGSN